jgi:hypothetical protein
MRNSRTDVRSKSAREALADVGVGIWVSFVAVSMLVALAGLWFAPIGVHG